ncbi:hypothetical protein [Streptomyces sp. NPDC001985]|uniref:hypothetical protein n=1 Tax=Streptomyces sp. NPDC001985 TaxID=3154406 RepID=UPI003325C580
MGTPAAPPTEANLAYLSRAITAIENLDAQAYFNAAGVFVEVADLLVELSGELGTRSRRLTSEQGGAKGWTGEGAEAFLRVAAELEAFLTEFAEVVRGREAPTRAAGEDVLELKRGFEAILQANAVNGGGRETTPQVFPDKPPALDPVVPFEAYIA